jgi:hypothetical protein
MTRTFWPAWSRPASRRPCSAASPDTVRTAACSKLSAAGLRTSLASRAAAYSANAPRPTPSTSSPTANRVTADPTAATVPATSIPGTGFFGRRNPKPTSRMRYGCPAIMCHVPRSTPAARTRTRTSSAAMAGRTARAGRRTSAALAPYSCCTIARMVSVPPAVPGWCACSAVPIMSASFIVPASSYLHCK